MFFIFTMFPQIADAQHGKPCCEILPPNSNDVLFNDGTHVSAAISYLNQNIYVSGSVFFDANVTMTRCTLIMCDHAFLNVNGSLLTIKDDLVGNQSVITGCTSKWSRININAGASIKLLNSIVRDGINGISFNQGFNNNTCQIEGNLFSGNTTAIRSDNTSNFTFQNFSDNTFTAVRLPIVGIPQNNNVPLPPLTNTRIGVKLTDVTGAIGTGPIGFQNVFVGDKFGPGGLDGLTYGIWAENSDFSVQNCAFMDITGEPTAAIQANFSSLTIEKNFTNGASCEFIRNELGIRSLRTIRLTLKDADFYDQLSRDVEVRISSGFMNVVIQNNDFQIASPRSGSIHVERPAAGFFLSTGVRIINNRIFTPKPRVATLNASYILISVVSSPVGVGYDNAIIADNEIDCDFELAANNLDTRFAHGIFGTGPSFGYQIFRNTVSYNLSPATHPASNSLTSVGIGLAFAPSAPAGFTDFNVLGPTNIVRTGLVGGACSNAVVPAAIGPQNCSWIKCGIHNDAAQNTLVCTNSVDNVFQAYHFSGDLRQSWGNEFGHNDILTAHVGVNFCTGLGCATGTRFPDQDYRMNVWNGSYSLNKGNYPNFMNLNVGTTWLVDPIGAGQDPTIAPNQANPAGWYDNTISNGEVSQSICNGILPPPTGGGVEPPIKANVRIANDPTAIGFPHVANKWDFERVLIGQMLETPSVYQNDPISVSYFQNKSGTVVGQIAQAERLIAQASKQSPQYQNQLQALLTSAADKSEHIVAFEHQANSSGFNADQAVKTALLDDLNTLRTQIIALENLLLNARTAYIANTVEPFVNGIQPNLTIETNFKIYLLKKVKLALGESFNDEDLTTIRAIANLCRDSDGEVVAAARMMLPEDEYRTYPVEGEEGYCTGQFDDHSIEDRRTPFQITDMDLFPNPVDASLEIDFDEPFSGILTIFDVLGKQYFEAKCENARSFLVDASVLLTGTYLVTMMNEKGQKRTFKFIVLH